MITWYRETILETGRSGVLWMLIAFVITFAITRLVTRHIRAKSAAGDDEEEEGLVGDVHIGGVHIHHQVWGILLILVAAVLEFAYQPDTPGVEVLGAIFGVGAALTLDEFALWVHLDDVYWSKEGRKSIDAIDRRGLHRRGPADRHGAVRRRRQRLPGGPDHRRDHRPRHDRLLAGERAQGQAGLRPDRPLLVRLQLRRGDTPGQAGLTLGPAAVPGASQKMERAERRFGPERQERLDRLRDLLGGAPDPPASREPQPDRDHHDARQGDPRADGLEPPQPLVQRDGGKRDRHHGVERSQDRHDAHQAALAAGREHEVGGGVEHADRDDRHQQPAADGETRADGGHAEQGDGHRARAGGDQAPERPAPVRGLGQQHEEAAEARGRDEREAEAPARGRPRGARGQRPPPPARRASRRARASPATAPRRGRPRAAPARRVPRSARRGSSCRRQGRGRRPPGPPRR